MALFKPATRRLPLKLTALQDTTDPVALSCEFRRRHAPETQPEDRFDSSSNGSTTQLWRLCPWHLQPATPAGIQVNLPLFSCYRSKGTSLPRWRRGTTVHQGERLARSQTGRSTSCASFPHSHTYMSTRKERRVAYSPFNRTTMEPLPHGLWSCSSKPLTGRTGHQLRDASAPGTTGDTAFTGLSPTTGQGLVPRRHAL